VPVPLIEGHGLLDERAVERVHDWRGDAIGHRQRGEVRVVVHDIERLAELGGEVDLVPNARDMV